MPMLIFQYFIFQLHKSHISCIDLIESKKNYIFLGEFQTLQEAKEIQQMATDEQNVYIVKRITKH